MPWVWFGLLGVVLAVFLMPAFTAPARVPPPEVDDWQLAFDIALLVVPLVLVVAYLVWGRRIF